MYTYVYIVYLDNIHNICKCTALMNTECTVTLLTSPEDAPKRLPEVDLRMVRDCQDWSSL